MRKGGRVDSRLGGGIRARALVLLLLGLLVVEKLVSLLWGSKGGKRVGKRKSEIVREEAGRRDRRRASSARCRGSAPAKLLVRRAA